MSSQLSSNSESSSDSKLFALMQQRPLIMGVLNTTPDSFSDGGSYFSGDKINPELLRQRILDMVSQGVDIIDVGGESTRPGAKPVSEQQELERVIPTIELIKRETDTLISVDTSTAQVIRESSALGINLINDVRALSRDGALAAAAASGLPVCLMHMQGNPDTMQDQPQYDGVVEEVLDYLMQRVKACEAAGINRDKILLDPGFGFGKSLEHNLELFSRLDSFAKDFALLVGVSRKSMIGQVLKRELDQRLAGSLALALLALQKGANILRVHDIAETVDTLRIWQTFEDQHR